MDAGEFGLFTGDYLSTHQSPAYPGTGTTKERGIGAGLGTTYNFPLHPGSGDETVVPIYTEKVPEILSTFRPDILMVSAGYDLHEADPLAQLTVTTEGVRHIVEAILDATNKPVIFLLEGGYDIQALGECVATTLVAMSQR